VVALVGSPRRRGNSSLLVDAAQRELEVRGCRVEKVMLAQLDIAPCLGHDDCAEHSSCPRNDDAAALLDRVYSADGLILATPVYYENVSAQLKTFIDRNVFMYSKEQWLQARAVGLIAVTAETGLEETLGALRRYVALSTQAEPPLYTLGGYADTLGAVVDLPELLAAARRLGAEIAGALLAEDGAAGPAV
jgi:multimeric flavodoxin WrbA